MAQMGSKAGNQDYDRMVAPLDNEELEGLYLWVDQISLSRTKRNISRDFSDGVLVAEIIKYCFPDAGLIDLHNYTSACATNKKKGNWYYLNRHVFTRLNFELADEVINDLAAAKPGMIEKVLLMLKMKITHLQYAQRKQNDKPEADQHMTPGRKNGRMVKGVMDDGKGSKFVKTKHVEHIPLRQRLKMPITETDVVPRIMLEEREQEVLAKDEMVKILQAKISRLEHLLHLKDCRIEDLQGRVETMRPTGIKK